MGWRGRILKWDQKFLDLAPALLAPPVRQAQVTPISGAWCSTCKMRPLGQNGHRLSPQMATYPCRL